MPIDLTSALFARALLDRHDPDRWLRCDVCQRPVDEITVLEEPSPVRGRLNTFAIEARCHGAIQTMRTSVRDFIEAEDARAPIRVGEWRNGVAFVDPASSIARAPFAPTRTLTGAQREAIAAIIREIVDSYRYQPLTPDLLGEMSARATSELRRQAMDGPFERWRITFREALGRRGEVVAELEPPPAEPPRPANIPGRITVTVDPAEAGRPRIGHVGILASEQIRAGDLITLGADGRARRTGRTPLPTFFVNLPDEPPPATGPAADLAASISAALPDATLEERIAAAAEIVAAADYTGIGAVGAIDEIRLAAAYVDHSPAELGRIVAGNIRRRYAPPPLCAAIMEVAPCKRAEADRLRSELLAIGERCRASEADLVRAVRSLAGTPPLEVARGMLAAYTEAVEAERAARAAAALELLLQVITVAVRAWCGAPAGLELDRGLGEHDAGAPVDDAADRYRLLELD